MVMQKGSADLHASAFNDGKFNAEFWQRGMSQVQATADILEAVCHIHMHDVFHLDLKPQNLLVCSGGMRPQLVLADFGQTTTKKHACRLEGGTLVSALWRAPEMFFGPTPTEATDLWSVGVTIAQVASYTLQGDSDLLTRPLLLTGGRSPPDSDPDRCLDLVTGIARRLGLPRETWTPGRYKANSACFAQLGRFKTESLSRVQTESLQDKNGCVRWLS